MYTLQHATTAHSASAAIAMLAQLQAQFTNYTVSAQLQSSNSYYNITVTRKFKCYNKAVKHFNKTVQQFCNTAAQHVDAEEHVASCYVLDAEGGAAY